MEIMTTERVADMTLEELKALISTVVKDELRNSRQVKDGRSLEEVLASMDRIRWTPPPGSKTTLELLREDRDR